MSWKDEYQLLDMELHWVIGFHCKNKKCGAYVGHSVKDLLKRFDKQIYPSEIERRAVCRQRGCRSPMRIELSHSDLLEAFQGGLP